MEGQGELVSRFNNGGNRLITSAKVKTPEYPPEYPL